ncbi:SPRY domain-containing protein 3-like [Lytechinus variegatus]|uniref:SPRY domain-containing protein 3-like n=1 Tax=Lytechinus variegatus TaxID=7654 RepID=UPI001BB1CCDD|nr:SPRY domain-containing protein 3-like [Lytechinus variegatus]
MDPRMDPRRRRRRLADNGEDLFAQLLGRRNMQPPRHIAANHIQGPPGPVNVGRPFHAPNFAPPALRFGQQAPAQGGAKRGEVQFIKGLSCMLLNLYGKARSFRHTGGRTKEPVACIALVDLTEEENFFEVEIKGQGVGSEEIRVGLAMQSHPTDAHLGSTKTSVGYSVYDGKGYFGRPDTLVCPPAHNFDKVGIALHFERAECSGEDASTFICPLSVVVNGKRILQEEIALDPLKPFYPAFSLGGREQHVKYLGLSRWSYQEEDMLIDDVMEEQMWRRVNHASVNGQIVTYTGKGEDFSEFGMAQGRKRLGPANHYFELEIIDPGRSCYVALGVTRKDYPTNMHPGWDRGSIAYHADDGKIFTGHGVGNPFGPKCHKGDIMGCGIMFPRDYQADSDDGSDTEEEIIDEWRPGKPNPNRLGEPGDQDNVGIHLYDFSDDEDLWLEDELINAMGDGQRKQERTKVQVFFTRNGTTIGRRENVTIPAGGFYPTVGLLSPEEKVRVDLQPLSG